MNLRGTYHVPRAPTAPPVPAEVPPLLKYVGSKRWLAPTIVPAINVHLHETGGFYYEPFVGGGAIAFALGSPRMVLSDSCGPLIDTYKTVARTPDAVHQSLSTLIERGTDEAGYYLTRGEHDIRNPSFAAARFIYLNKFGFNGVVRFNREGKFNVPYGKQATRGVPAQEELQRFAQVMRPDMFNVADFRVALANTKIRRGDVVFADPPYYTTYDGYAADGFTEVDHKDLSDILAWLAACGVAVITTNSDHPKVHELYQWATVRETAEKHSVAQKAASRGLKKCLLAFKGIALP